MALKSTNYALSNYDIFIGLDVHKNSITFTAQDFYNQQGNTKRILASAEHIHNYIQKHFSNNRVLCVYEAGPTGFSLYDSFQTQKADCMITSPLSVQKAIGSRVKNDRIDSQALSQQLKNGQLKAIRVPQGAYRELRHLVKSRHHYSLLRKQTKQRIKALLLYENLHMTLRDEKQNFSNKYLEKLSTLQISSSVVRERLDMLLSDLDYVRKQIFIVHRKIREFIGKNQEIKTHIGYLTSIPGVGPLTATGVLATIGDPKYLGNMREIGSFLGLTPAERSSGDKQRRGNITHLGNLMARSLLIEAAWSAIQKDQSLNYYYQRIKARHPKKIGPRKAIVAVARKMTQIIYRILKEQRDYKIHK